MRSRARLRARHGLATLVGDHPGYAYLTAARLRAEMLKAVHAGDLDRARAMARERTPELPLPLNDDRLFDAVLALGDGAPRGEAKAVLAEVDGADECRHWFERAAPAVLRALRAHDSP